MLGINMDDVIGVLESMRTELIIIGVATVIAIVVLIAAIKIPKPVKALVRGEAGIAWLLVVLIAANMICTGPMYDMLNRISVTSYIEDATSAAATQLVSEIVEEGVILAKNEDDILPLASGTQLSVFGWASAFPVYGGTGSGALNTAYPITDLLTGLQNAGIVINDELRTFYHEYQKETLNETRPAPGMWEQDWTLPEPNVNAYSDALLDNAVAFNPDVAMIVIARSGGENADLPTDMTAVMDGSYVANADNAGYFNGSYNDALNEGNDWDEGDHYLQLTNREEELVDLVTSRYDNVIVVYNGANAMEMDWVNDYPQIKGVLLCPGTGQSGFDGFGRVVTGAANPSGRTVDTYVTSLKNAPWWNNFGHFKYTNMEEHHAESNIFDPEGPSPTFVNYVEGIYVGYKFYETAAEEGLIDYDAEVVYPFGYGLSYTTFEQTLDSVTYDGTNVNYSVTVKNTGSKAGKDVVELYFTPPYTNGGIEKASVNLMDFAKTDLLEPGASQTVTGSIPVEQLASYDDQGAGCYVLDAGEYVISIRENSHDVIDSQTFNVGSTITYGESNKRESDDVAAVNQFDFARGDVTYLSRADGFANYDAATAAPTNFEMDQAHKDTFYSNANYLTAEATATDEDPNAAPVTTGADNNIQLMELRGLDYDDPKWDEFLDQLTLDEMNTLIAGGGYQTADVLRLGKVRTNDNDGPASINNNFTGVGSVGFPAATLIANAWNKDLAYSFGDSIGTMADQMNTSGWYGPAMNIHRTAFAGRNFEYYSEDGLLSGAMAANAIAGAQSHGVYAYMKHFALNDQEGNRTAMLCTWSTEQAMREIYLKPFEISVKQADCKAVMSSFNYIGNRWADGCSELCQTVLRDEWGFRGFVETDYFGGYGYQSADQAVRNGTDLMLSSYPSATSSVTLTSTNGAQQAMRTAAKNILYTVVWSRAYEEDNYEKATATPLWRTILTVVNVVVAVVAVILEVLLIKSFLDKRKKAA